MVMQYEEIDRRLTHLESAVSKLEADVVELRVDVAYIKGAVDRLSWLMPLILVVGMATAGALSAIR